MPSLSLNQEPVLHPLLVRVVLTHANSPPEIADAGEDKHALAGLGLVSSSWKGRAQNVLERFAPWQMHLWCSNIVVTVKDIEEVPEGHTFSCWVPAP